MICETCHGEGTVEFVSYKRVLDGYWEPCGTDVECRDCDGQGILRNQDWEEEWNLIKECVKDINAKSES